MSMLLTKNKKLIIIALAVVLIVTAVVLLNPRTGTSDLPPTLSLPRSLLQGSTNIACLMPGYRFDDEDVANYVEPIVYPAPEKSDLRVDDHIYFADKDMTVSDIFDNIKPVVGNKVTLAYYSNGQPGLTPGFYLYPQVEGNFAISEPNEFIIPRNHGFILFSCLQSRILNVRSEEKGGLALPEPAMREARDTWLLTSLADMDDLEPYSHRIDDIYYQNAQGIGVPFEKLGEDELRNSAFFAVWLKIETATSADPAIDITGVGPGGTGGTGAPIVPPADSPAERRLPDGLGGPDEDIVHAYEYEAAEAYEPEGPVAEDDVLPEYVFTAFESLSIPNPPDNAFEITDVTFPKNNRNKVAPFPTIELEVKTTDSFSTEAFDGYTFAVHYKIDDADQRKLRTRAEWEARTARTDVPYTITQAWPNNAPKIDDYDSYQNFSYDYRSYTEEEVLKKNLSTPLLKQALSPSRADETIHLTIDNFGLNKDDQKDVTFYIVGYRAADDQRFVLAEQEFGNRKDPRPDVTLGYLRGGAAYDEYDDNEDATLFGDITHYDVDFVHLAGRFPENKDISDSYLTVSLGYWHEDEDNDSTKELTNPDPITVDTDDFEDDLDPIFTEGVEATEDECDAFDCIGEAPYFKWRIGEFDEDMQLRAKNWEKAYFNRDSASEWKSNIAIPTTHKSLEFFVVNLRSNEQYPEEAVLRGKYYYVFVEITNRDGFSRVFFFPPFKIGDYDDTFNDTDYLVEAED